MALRTARSSAIGLLVMTNCRGATIQDRRALPAVNNGPWVASELGQLIPQQRTCSDYCGMSVWCSHEETCARRSQQIDPTAWQTQAENHNCGHALRLLIL